MNLLNLIVLLALSVLFGMGCATKTQLPDGSYDTEYGVPIRAMVGNNKVATLPDGRIIYYQKVEKKNARCFIVFNPGDKVAAFVFGSGHRQHWVCVLQPPGQPYWVNVDFDEDLTEIRWHEGKFGTEREAFIRGKFITYQRLQRYRR